MSRAALRVAAAILLLGPVQAAAEDADGGTTPQPEAERDSAELDAPLAPPPLRIASFDMSEAPAIAAVRPEPVKRPSWRTSFGAEIRPSEKRTAAMFDLEADVVLLQGVVSMREVRRIFPARGWKLVVSRQLLDRADPLAPFSDVSPDGSKATAVAVRYQRGWRVTGQDRLMDMAVASNTRGAPDPAASAVRLALRGQSFWLVSAELTPACLEALLTCPAFGALQAWRAKRELAGEPVIAGGVLARTATGSCAHQTIEAGGGAKAGHPGVVPAARHALAGCLARTTLDPRASRLGRE